MEGEKHNPIVIIALVIILIAVGAVLLGQKGVSEENTYTTPASAEVSIENTAEREGVIPPPDGFPLDIPLENNTALVVSMTTYHSAGTLLSVSYESEMSQADKISEYREYLTRSGYQVREKDKNGVLKLYGEKLEGDIFISVHQDEDGSLVEVSYLLK